MRVILLWILIILPGLLFSNPAVIKKARELFYQATYENIEVEAFVGFLKKVKPIESPTIKGYQAMAFMLKSKESWNPYHKFDYFLKGKNLLENAIQEDYFNIELRYLRLCLQSSLPGILNYDQNIGEDQKFILARWKSIEDEDLQNKIRKALLDLKLI